MTVKAKTLNQLMRDVENARHTHNSILIECRNAEGALERAMAAYHIAMLHGEFAPTEPEMGLNWEASYEH